MSANKQHVQRAFVEIARLSGLPRLFGHSLGGVGAILAMHRVRPASEDVFQPNKTLEVTPDFLDRTLSQIRDAGFDIISLDEMRRRLDERDFERRFVCLTLDDGYADNYHHAFPVFKAHQAPFSIYLTTGFVDRTAFLWWMLLEEVVRRNDEVTLDLNGASDCRKTRTPEEKAAAYKAWHRLFRVLAADDVEAEASRFCETYGIDPAAVCAEHAMTWNMAREITADGLGTIEAHTERHIATSLQEPEAIRDDMTRVFARIAEKTGRTPRHFAFPFGDAAAVSTSNIELLGDLPPATATTTRPGVLKPEHKHALTALPRITLNGYYQSKGYVDLALSGLPFLLSRS